MADKRGYTRHLPHHVPEGAPLFLTWNLKGAMPRAAIEEVANRRRALENQAPRPGETTEQRRIRENKMIFALADRFLDTATAGAVHLKDANAAKIVEDAILFGAVERYDLFAWCVISNHVHALLLLHWELPKVTKGIKGYTAREINVLQDAPWRIFWQDESYDHWVRDEEEMQRIIQYIENNPVAAGLCQRPEEWPRSSARFRIDWRPGDVYVFNVKP